MQAQSSQQPAPGTEEPTLEEATAWLTERGLLSPANDLSAEQVLRRYAALSKCAFGEAVSEGSRRRFLQRLVPCEARLAAKQTDIGRVEDPRFHYKLKLRNEVGIKARPMRLRPEEEAWLDVHLDELVAKGVIGPILPDEQPRCVTPLLLVPGVQSGQPYRVCQNIVPVNKRTDEYQYQLNDTRRYRAQLGRSKWVSMIDLKAGFHNIPFEHESSYDSTFVTHRGKFRWLRMPMGLTQAPAHFQFVVEAVLKGAPGERPLPVVVYLDDIAVHGDDQEQVLEDTLEAVRRLTRAGFMINLKKSHLVEDAAKVLGHHWSSGGFWAPNVSKLQALLDKSDAELARMSRSSLYGLLNFYREYVPAFAELVEPLRELLGQDALPWTPGAAEAVREVARRVIDSPKWLNASPEEELRMESRVTPAGIAIVLLQRHPEHPRTWAPVASWGRCLDALETSDSRVLLELKALREGAWKLSEYTAYAQNLTMRVSKELRALLKVAHKAHPELQALLVDLMQYRPKLLVDERRAAPEELDMASEVAPAPTSEEEREELNDMATAEAALQEPMHLPPKARFAPGKAIHVQFDGGSQDGIGTGGFVILDGDGNEVVRAGRYYGPGRTNNEAESFAMRDAAHCLRALQAKRPDLRLPVRVFGDSQLLIRFMLRIYKKPQRHTIYWAVEDMKRAERELGGQVAYRHITRDANCVADDMARRALDARGDVAYWAGDLPQDAPPNQLQEVYEQQGVKPKLAWADMPAPAPWDARIQGAPSVGVASAFGARCAARIRAVALRQAQEAALQRLGEVADTRCNCCLASAAIGAGTLSKLKSLLCSSVGPSAIGASTSSGHSQGAPRDERPCIRCGGSHDQHKMVLCDRCNACYHPQCAEESDGTRLHGGPWFCHACKGYLILWGAPDVTQDWPLMDYLWTGVLPQDPDERDRLVKLGESYRAVDDELQVLLPAQGHHRERWVDVPPLIARPQLLADTHEDLGHCGREKLLRALRERFWWPGMHADARDCVRRCAVCQKERVPPPPLEEVRWIDKGSAPFIGWSVDAAGPFPQDGDGNRYLLVAVDPFSKWVEALAVPSLNSWRAAEFLQREVIERWGKPRYVRTDHGSEFKGSFARLCKVLGIVHQQPTTGNSKGNGQVERIIRTIKDALRRGLTRWEDSYWSDHLGAALMLLRFTASRATGLAPFTLLTGRAPLLPSVVVPPEPLPNEPTPEQEALYQEALLQQVARLQELGGERIREAERRVRELTRAREGQRESPTLLFHFQPGQFVIKRQKRFTKVEARALGPYRVRKVSGAYRQRVTIEPLAGRGRPTIVHASHLVPYDEPYVEPQAVDLGAEDEAEPPPARERQAAPAERKRRRA